jgi:hypothetical protein
MIHIIHPPIHPTILPPLALQPFVGPWPLFQFLDPIQSAGPFERGSARHKDATCIQKNTKANKRTQISMPLVGFEATIPVFEQAKTVHALDRAVIVID